MFQTLPRYYYPPLQNPALIILWSHYQGFIQDFKLGVISLHNIVAKIFGGGIFPGLPHLCMKPWLYRMHERCLTFFDPESMIALNCLALSSFWKNLQRLSPLISFRLVSPSTSRTLQLRAMEVQHWSVSERQLERSKFNNVWPADAVICRGWKTHAWFRMFSIQSMTMYAQREVKINIELLYSSILHVILLSY